MPFVVFIDPDIVMTSTSRTVQAPSPPQKVHHDPFPYASTPEKKETLAFYALKGLFDHAVSDQEIKEGFASLQGSITSPRRQAALLLFLASSFKHSTLAQEKSIAFLEGCEEAGWRLPRTLLKQKDIKVAYQRLWDDLCTLGINIIQCQGITSSSSGLCKTHPKTSRYMALILKVMPPPAGLKSHLLQSLAHLNFPFLEALRSSVKGKKLPTLSSKEVQGNLIHGLLQSALGKAQYLPLSAFDGGHLLSHYASQLAPALPQTFFDELQLSIETSAFFRKELSPAQFATLHNVLEKARCAYAATHLSHALSSASETTTVSRRCRL